MPMDLGQIPDIANHFATAVQTVLPFIHHIADAVTNAAANIWSGMTDPHAMAAGDRGFQMMKLTVATFGLCASIGTMNIEGAAACAVTDCEAVMEFAKAGAKARHLAL